MQVKNVISNFSLLTRSTSGITNLRNYILTEAVSGSFSKTKPDSWKKTTLGAEVDIIRGITFPSSAKHREPSEDRIVCLRTTNVQDLVDWNDLLYVPERYVKNENQYIRINDILISMANSRELVGKVSLVTRNDIRCTLGGFIAAIRCSETILPEFLMILLRVPATKEKIIDSSTQTTNIANISLGRLRPLQISLPTLQEQLNIVNKVSQLFERCDQLETSLNDLQALSKSTRRSLVDCISNAQNPEELQTAWERIRSNWELIAGSPESMGSIKLLIHDLAIQGIFGGENTFQELSLKDLSTISYGYTESAQTSEVGPKFLRITDIQLGKVNWDSVPYCPISEAEEAKHLLKNGDLVFARTGATTGKSFLLKNPPRSVCASYLIRVRPDFNRVIPEYLYLYFQSGQYWVDVLKGMSGTAQGGFNSSKLGGLSIRVPDIESQAVIVKKVQELLDICETLENVILKREVLTDKFSRSVVAASV
jgi:type I restriction enzyme S subunit